MSNTIEALAKIVQANRVRLIHDTWREPRIRYVCPVCNDGWDDEDSARECCQTDLAAPCRCPVCLQAADDFDEAVECCLPGYPLTHWAREEILRAIRGGKTWEEAIERHSKPS